MIARWRNLSRPIGKEEHGGNGRLTKPTFQPGKRIVEQFVILFLPWQEWTTEPTMSCALSG